MECAESLSMLSDYLDGALDEERRNLVTTHLLICTMCDGVFTELKVIVVTAGSLRTEAGMVFPDEDALWQKLSRNTQSTV